MSHATYLIGDVREALATLPDSSVDLIATSPPFLALRAYLPDAHPHKHHEIGTEASPGAYVDTLLAVTAAWRRVLAPHGSIAVEIGDTFAGSGGPGGDYNAGGARAGQPKTDGSARRRRLGPRATTRLHADATTKTTAARRLAEPANVAHSAAATNGAGWPLAKSLALVPEAYRLGLVYGHNPLTGAASPAGRWRVRNVVRWHKPNPAVGALADKFRPATSDLVIACLSPRRWFDEGAIRDPAPLHDTWTIPTESYHGAHYATWPSALVVRLIEAMAPREVCVHCGEPRRRITQTDAAHNGHPANSRRLDTSPATLPLRAPAQTAQRRPRPATPKVTVGWTTCDCESPRWRRGLVLDPFAGTATTLAVATGAGRDAIGIDIDARNGALAQARVGMFLHVRDLRPAGAPS